ncbi:MAG TPA: tRNA (guanosine(37)-N1)-methyltransferase TrmD [Candidatus Saccharimonadales bacterium]|nr:tRNA (guanosine(37)-N1)-methyltransferase TrmD [Candidatus Saccharimonadales bacterium]
MTRFFIITLFPQIFDGFTTGSIIGRAIGKKIISIKFINPRDFAKDKYKSVDDKPYGGGAGMVMKVENLVAAIESIKPKSYIVLLSASGKKYTQKIAKELAKKKNIALVCGHYEGIDARVEEFVDEVISVGDYVTTGGEVPAMAIIDSISRLIPGAITERSLNKESFDDDLLEAPQYTRPEDFRGLKVPQALLSGNHKQIETWRKEQAKKRTKKYRPDLL